MSNCKEIPMFQAGNEDEYIQVLPGIQRKTLVYGDKMLMTEFRLKKGHSLPRHAHPHEQIGYLVRGRIRLGLGDQCYEIRQGDSWCIPGGVEHGVEILEDAVAVEVFSPLREDYLPGK